mmetsp:Transcript_43156/g.82311  ORF Transcript_43156/g.82311 Transcript_43156/m.82311 type:complete len:257 (+) Transcript_43156:1290-2060(+)
MYFIKLSIFSSDLAAVVSCSTASNPWMKSLVEPDASTLSMVNWMVKYAAREMSTMSKGAMDVSRVGAEGFPLYQRHIFFIQSLTRKQPCTNMTRMLNMHILLTVRNVSRRFSVMRDRWKTCSWRCSSRALSNFTSRSSTVIMPSSGAMKPNTTSRDLVSVSTNDCVGVVWPSRSRYWTSVRLYRKSTYPSWYPWAFGLSHCDNSRPKKDFEGVPLVAQLKSELGSSVTYELHRLGGAQCWDTATLCSSEIHWSTYS